MKTEVETTAPARTYKVAHYTCSRCGEPCGEDEKSGSYEVKEAEVTLKNGTRFALNVKGDDGFLLLNITNIKKIVVQAREGSSYPEGSQVTAEVVDCCLSCFREHALPALINAGFKVREEDQSW